MEKTMKFKVGQIVRYFADDTQEFYSGMIKDVSENFIKPEFTQYQISFAGGDFWMYECDLQEVV